MFTVNEAALAALNLGVFNEAEVEHTCGRRRILLLGGSGLQLRQKFLCDGPSRCSAHWRVRLSFVFQP